MASGVDLKKYPKHVVSAMVAAQLDSDLADYYNLIALANINNGDAGKAQKAIDSFIRVAIPELAESSRRKQKEIEELVDGMDTWMLGIDINSLPKNTSGFIKRDKPVDFTPRRRKRK